MALVLAGSLSSQAAYYDTLPKGVRTLDLRQIVTDNINSSFTGNKQEAEYAFKIDLGANSIEGLNNITQDIFETLKDISPEAYDSFTFGEYSVKGSANANVRVFGFGYGITNRMTAYVGFPWYKTQVNLDIQRTKGNNHQAVLNQLQASGSNSQEAQIFTDFAKELPDATGEVLQSVVVNYFGYKPLGNWNGEGIGDTEVGIIYRLTDWDESGLAMTIGANLPTGRVDDPDILQDYGFGDGQTDAFLEFGGGVSFFDQRLSVDSWTRLTYQFAAEKTLRIPENEEYQLGSEKTVFDEKLGNKVEYNFGLGYGFTDWLSLTGLYSYNYVQQSKYESAFTDANRILEKNTEQESHALTAGLSLSTVGLYNKGTFMLPFNASVSATNYISAQNQPKYSLYTLKLRFFF